MIIKGLTAFVYDVEVFPNLFTCAVKNSESGGRRVYEISERKNELKDLLSLFCSKGIIFVGYNNLHYDDPLINYLLMNYDKIKDYNFYSLCTNIKQMSDTIIDSKVGIDAWSQYKYAHLFPSLDLLAMLFSSKLRVGLKAMQVTMQYKNVREYEGDFTKPIPVTEIDNLISYNYNDIESTTELMNRCKKDIDLRLGIEERYHIDVLNKDGVNLGMEVIKARYLEKTGLEWKDIKDLRSPCDKINLKEIIFPFIEFRNPVLKRLLADLKLQTVSLDSKFERDFVIGELPHTFGLGGLHSVNTPEIFEPDKDWILCDKDVTSLYPSIVIEYGICPEHLNKDIFVGNFADMKAERVAAKKAGDTITNMTLKLALNGFTGNLQSKYSWVYSPKSALKIRINGQLMLCMLLERLISVPKVKIIQSNTDGVFFMYHKDSEDLVNRVCDEWQAITKLNLETDYFERFYQYAINDYLGVKQGWSETHNPKCIKTKGLFIDEITLGKGMSPQIIAEALKEYFVNKVPVNDILYNCTDIRKFLTYQKIDKKFDVEYNGKLITHINRYYMSVNGYKLRKCTVDPKTGNRSDYQDICATSGVTILNELSDVDTKTAHINYAYYRNEIYKIIYALEDSKQPTLF